MDGLKTIDDYRQTALCYAEKNLQNIALAN